MYLSLFSALLNILKPVRKSQKPFRLLHMIAKDDVFTFFKITPVLKIIRKCFEK